MDLELRGHRVIVTAGAAGIGRAIVEAFLAEGARVATCDIDAQGLATRAAADKLTWASVGLFKPGLFADIVPGTRLALRPQLEAALDAGRLAASRWDGPWTDVGTPQRLEELNASTP